MSYTIYINGELVANGLSYGEFTSWLYDYVHPMNYEYFATLGNTDSSDFYEVLDSIDWSKLEEWTLPIYKDNDMLLMKVKISDF